MSSPLLMAAFVVLAMFSDPMNDGVPRGGAVLDPARDSRATGANAPEPSVVYVRAGDPAPDFWYSGADGHNGRLRDLLAQGPVLLVFGAGEPALASLQRERDALVGLGVVPVAIADLRPGAVRAVTKRLALTYPVVPDPRAITAGQFNCLDPSTLRPMPSWFVIDRAGRVRALARGALANGRWAAVVSDALALPAPGAPRPVSQPR